MKSILIRGAVAALVLAGGFTLAAQASKANIDSACLSVLGKACSTESSLSNTYTTIVSQINNKKLASDTTSISYNYLMPLVKSNTGIQSTVVDWAYQANHCTAGSAEEGYWRAQVSTWQTYQALFNAVRAKGCAIPGSTPPAPVVAPNLTAAALTPGYQAVWGAIWNPPPVQMAACPSTSNAAACARSALMAYVQSRGASTVLPALVTPVFHQLTGTVPNPSQLLSIMASYRQSWTGADDLATYLNSTKSQWTVSQPAVSQTTTMYLRLDGSGNVVNGAGQTIPNTKGSYFLTVSGGQVVAAGGGNYVAWANGAAVMVKPLAISGVMVDNTSIAYRVVAQGGGNFSLSNSHGVVAQGGGNVVAAGGGNLVSTNGGNVVGTAGGSVAYPPAQALKIFAGVVSHDGGTLITSDGAGLNLAVLSKIVANK